MRTRPYVPLQAQELLPVLRMAFSLRSLDNRTWTYLVAGSAGLGAATSSALATWTAGPRFGLLAGVAVGLVLAAILGTFAIVHRRLAFLQMSVAAYGEEVKALINIRPLLGPVPIRWGGWAIDSVFAQALANVLSLSGPQLVVECGSGSSTVFLAACLRALGRGRVVSLEHDSNYAAQTRRLLEVQGLGDTATVLTAPLVRYPYGGAEYQWYGFEAAAILEKQSVNVLVVDGPPAYAADGSYIRFARLPAAYVLEEYLAPDCVIVMDDAARADEQIIGELWSQLLNARLEREPGIKGMQILRRCR